MITEEENEKKMKLSWPQIKKIMEKQISSRAFSSAQSGDAVSAKVWKAVMVKMQAKDIGQRVNEEFIQDFIKWLTGRSVFNATKYFEIVKDEMGHPVSKEVTGGCPWGNTPLTNLPGVSEFLDQGIDRRDNVIRYISKLKMRGPRNLNEAYMYYKYILRKVAVDDDACFEVEEMSDFDYPVDPETGNTVGPDTIDVPPLFDEVKYTANFLLIYALSIEYPKEAAFWISSGADALSLAATALNFRMDVDDVAGFMYTNDYDRIRDPVSGRYKYVYQWKNQGYDVGGQEEYLRRDEHAREEARRRDRRRRLRKAGRGPELKTTAGNATRAAPTPGTASFENFKLGPDGRRQARSINRREQRRDDAAGDKREDTLSAMGVEGFGTDEYVSFWALSSSDQDYIMSMLLAQNAFSAAGDLLQSTASTAIGGGPTVPDIHGRNEAQYAYPGEESEENAKRHQRTIEKLQELGKKINSLPGAAADPQVAKILNEINFTTQKINKKLDNPPPATIINQTPININTDSLSGVIEANTVMIDKLKMVINNLGVKIDNANFGGGGGSTPQFNMPPGLQNKVGEIDVKLGRVLDVLGGLPHILSNGLGGGGPPNGGGAGYIPPTMNTNYNTFTGETPVSAPNGQFSVDSATVTNNYNIGDIHVPQLIGQEIGRNIYVPPPQVNVSPNVNVNVPDIHVPAPQVNINVPDVHVPAPQVNVGNVNVSPNVNVENVTVNPQLGNITVSPNVNVENVSVFPQVGDIQVSVPAPNISYTLPQGMGAEIGQNINVPAIDVNVLGQAIGKSMPAPGSVNVDFTPLLQKFDQHTAMLQQRDAEYAQREQLMRKEITGLYEEFKQLGTKESARLDLMKEMLDKMTPLQTQVASIMAQNKEAANQIQGPIELEERPLQEKLEQLVSLSPDTIKQLLAGTNEGIAGLKTEIAAVSENLKEYLTTTNESTGEQITMLAAMKHLITLSGTMSENMKAVRQQYAPEGMKPHTGATVMSEMLERLNDTGSVLNGKVQVADVGGESFDKMVASIGKMEGHLANNEKLFQQQQQILNARQAVLEKTFEDTLRNAETKSTEEKEVIKQQLIQMSNEFIKQQAQMAATANEFTALSLSHSALKEELVAFQNRPPAPPPPSQPAPNPFDANFFEGIKGALKGVVQSDIVPEIKSAAQRIEDAIDNSSIGLDDDKGEGTPPANQQKENISKEERAEALSVVEAREEVIQGLQEQQAIEPAEPVNPQMFVSKAVAEQRKTLEDLVNEALAENPNATTVDVLMNPIKKLIAELNPIKESIKSKQYNNLSPEETSRMNEVFATEAFSMNAERSFAGLPESIKNQFLQPISGIAGTKEQVSSVIKGLTLLTRGKTAEGTRGQYDSAMELLTNYQQKAEGMRQLPGSTGHSVLAKSIIGKYNGIALRSATHHSGVRPTNVNELDGYVALNRIGKQMVNAIKKEDVSTFNTLKENVAGFGSFNENAYVVNSPLYKAMASGDVEGIIHSQAQPGTSHLQRDYFSSSIKARTDLMYDAFRDYVQVVPDTLTPDQQTQEIEKIEHAVTNMEYSGLGKLGILNNADFSDEISKIKADEASVYLEAFAKAALVSKLQIIKDGMATESRTTQNKLKADAQSIGKMHNEVATQSAAFYADNVDKELVAKAQQTRQATVMNLASHMYNAMRSQDTQSHQAVESNPDAHKQDLNTSTYIEATDTLTALANGDIIDMLSGQEIETPIASRGKGKLIASQLKKAFQGLEKEGNSAFASQLEAMTRDPILQRHTQEARQFFRDGSLSSLHPTLSHLGIPLMMGV